VRDIDILFSFLLFFLFLFFSIFYSIRFADKVNDIHGWNCAFEDDPAKIMTLSGGSSSSSSSNNINKEQQQENSLLSKRKSFGDILRGFFEFYATFQFHPHPVVSPSSSAAAAASLHNAAFIISTRTAQVLHSSQETQLSKLSAFINVQDPFDLSHNLTANISKSTLQRFMVECKGSSDLMQQQQQQNLTEPKKSQATGKCWGLMLLMTRKALPIMNVSNTTNISIIASDLLEKSSLHLRTAEIGGQNDSIVPQSQQAATVERQQQLLSVRKAIEFVMFVLKECLLFEQLDNGDEMVIKKRKRMKALNQICDQVDSLGLSCSPKRLKTSQEDTTTTTTAAVAAATGNRQAANTFVCLLGESLNNNNCGSGVTIVEDEDDEDGQVNSSDHHANKTATATKRVANYVLSIKHNTWQGRRAVKRDIKQHSPQSNDMQLEMMTSQKLIKESNSKEKTALDKPIHFRVMFNLKGEPVDAVTDHHSHHSTATAAAATADSFKYTSLEIKFDLLDEVRNQNDLINFTTIVHFLDVFINNCHEKFFDLWRCKQ
jgi:hypothetical protein